MHQLLAPRSLQHLLAVTTAIALGGCGDDTTSQANTTDGGTTTATTSTTGGGGAGGAGAGGSGAGGSGGMGGIGGGGAGGAGGSPAQIDATWSRHYGTTQTGYRNGSHIAVNANQEVYFAGYFDDDGGNQSPNVLAFGAGLIFTSSGKDGFVAKLDAQGQTLWAHHLNGTGDLEVKALQVDSTDALLVAVDLTGTLQIEGTPYVGSSVLIKYASDGSLVWARSYYGKISALDVGASDEIIVGAFSSFGDALSAVSCTEDLCVAKLSASGDIQWASGFDPQSVTGWVMHDVAVDAAGDVVFTGIEAKGSTSVDITVGKVSGANGATQWWQGFVGAGWDSGFGIDTDSSNNVFVVGAYEQSLTVGATTHVAQQDDVIVISLDPNGQVRWSLSAGPVFDTCCIGPRLGVDGQGNVIIAGGTETGTLDFGGTVFPGDTDDVFLAKLDNNGQHLFSRRFYGALSWAADVAVDPTGNSYITGQTRDTIDFGSGPLTSNGSLGDVLVVKFPPQ